MYAYITLYIWYFVGNVVATLFHIDEFVFNILCSWIAIIITNIWLYICTRWIVDTFVFSVADWNLIRIPCSPSISTAFSGPFSPKQSVSFVGSNLKLYELLLEDEGLNCFMDHLIYEFSHECLLSFIEMVQWKTGLNDEIMKCHDEFEYEEIERILLMNGMPNHYESPPFLQQNNESFAWLMLKDRNSNLHYKSHILLLRFPDEVPLSSILADERHDQMELVDDYKLKAFGVYNRYICNGCDMEININYQTRYTYTQLMQNLDQHELSILDLYTLFDEAILEMYKLMQDSYKRFKQTQAFTKLNDEIFNEKRLH
eukprot:545234_1